MNPWTHFPEPDGLQSQPTLTALLTFTSLDRILHSPHTSTSLRRKRYIPSRPLLTSFPSPPPAEAPPHQLLGPKWVTDVLIDLKQFYFRFTIYYLHFQINETSNIYQSQETPNNLYKIYQRCGVKTFHQQTDTTDRRGGLCCAQGLHLPRSQFQEVSTGVGTVDWTSVPALPSLTG